ncbi:MAG: Two-component transcriptional response regulator, LuxR family [uncultured Thermomicrobiales bacterium]|uniref:Two-component transcriptional response regulator, LuxR family n=1 Tax=uncultured Thermomicrobiales bacterium TaxID=1645740 RepID=A0A6J4USX5_9BACT|nr:MAG: Two-component transcriptional response regulator, LuxR family [uncultured Thermomicrobiales bacterium]
MSEQIRVIVIEQEALYRRGLVAVLDSTPDLHPAGSAETARDAYRLADAVQPDVALVGTTVSDAPGIELANELRRRHPAIAVVVIAASESDDELFAAIRAGASAYSGRDVGEEALVTLIRRSATGEYVINEQLLSKPYVAARVLEQFRNSTVADVALSTAFMPLTERELEILGKVSDGMTNAAIGEALGISPQTVKNHVTSILRKLAVNDRTQAVVTALRRGWLRLSDVPVNGGTPSGVTDTPTSRLGAARDDDP